MDALSLPKQTRPMRPALMRVVGAGRLSFLSFLLHDQGTGTLLTTSRVQSAICAACVSPLPLVDLRRPHARSKPAIEAGISIVLKVPSAVGADC
jgi:hypothetical protein